MYELNILSKTKIMRQLDNTTALPIFWVFPGTHTFLVASEVKKKQA